MTLGGDVIGKYGDAADTGGRHSLEVRPVGIRRRRAAHQLLRTRRARQRHAPQCGAPDSVGRRKNHSFLKVFLRTSHAFQVEPQFPREARDVPTTIGTFIPAPWSPGAAADRVQPSNPARPTVTFAAPGATGPGHGTTYNFNQQPVTLTIANAMRTADDRHLLRRGVALPRTFASTAFIAQRHRGGRKRNDDVHVAAARRRHDLPLALARGRRRHRR